MSISSSTTSSPLAIFDQLETLGHEQVVFCSQPELGLRAIVGIHNTTLGPALGGTRMWMYGSDAEALRDVLRLSRGMTYKAAVAGLNVGGGKAVIIGDPRKDKNEALFRAFGRFLQGLAGRYITAEDVGITEKDMAWVRMETPYVTGVSTALGGSGDPSPYTALGVYSGMKACAKLAYGSDSLEGKRIGIQGAGHVSTFLAQRLHEEGANIFVCDLFEEKAKQLAESVDGTFVEVDRIWDLEMDVFSPCALGGVLHPDSIAKIKCDIVAGAANNQFENEAEHAPLLAEKGILYAPDYVLNAGGLINVASELEGHNPELVTQRARNIYDVILAVFKKSEQEGLLTYEAANKLAEERISQVAKINNLYVSDSALSGRWGLQG